MMAVGEIRARALKAARDAAHKRKVPLVIEQEDLAVFRAWTKGEGPPAGSIPFIGEYVPKGWKRTENTYFVDSSGWGSPGEQALTFSQFLDKVTPGLGYAVVEAGQFQVYVGEYIPPRR